MCASESASPPKSSSHIPSVWRARIFLSHSWNYCPRISRNCLFWLTFKIWFLNVFLSVRKSSSPQHLIPVQRRRSPPLVWEKFNIFFLIRSGKNIQLAILRICGRLKAAAVWETKLGLLVKWQQELVFVTRRREFHHRTDYNMSQFCIKWNILTFHLFALCSYVTSVTIEAQHDTRVSCLGLFLCHKLLISWDVGASALCYAPRAPKSNTVSHGCLWQYILLLIFRHTRPLCQTWIWSGKCTLDQVLFHVNPKVTLCTSRSKNRSYCFW